MVVGSLGLMEFVEFRGLGAWKMQCMVPMLCVFLCLWVGGGDVLFYVIICEFLWLGRWEGSFRWFCPIVEIYVDIGCEWTGDLEMSKFISVILLSLSSIFFCALISPIRFIMWSGNLLHARHLEKWMLAFSYITMIDVTLPCHIFHI
jgi:hypothetical protein